MRYSALVVLLVCSIPTSSQNPKAPTPQTVTVTAKALSAAPGAIVCRDMDTVATVFDQYNAHWGDSFEDAVTGGQSRLIRGAPASAPNLKTYGCVLVAPGTKMVLHRGNVVPVISIKLPSGKMFTGVTLGDMFVESQVDKDAGWRARIARQSATPQAEPLEANAVAIAFGSIPGAIVCLDYNSTALMYEEYQDSERHGTSPPALALGCSIIPPGTKMHVARFGNEIHVDALFGESGKVSGITFPEMISDR